MVGSLFEKGGAKLLNLWLIAFYRRFHQPLISESVLIGPSSSTLADAGAVGA
jgi:hypothetical protein